MLQKRYSIRGIARALRRSASTISDELRRNKVNGCYDPDKANHKACLRRLRAKYQAKKIVEHPKLRDFVETELFDDQSPQAISGRIRQHEKQLPYISKESIYRYIASPYGRRVEYHRWRLKRTGKRRKNRSRHSIWDGRVFVDKRPKHIGNRERFGDAEGDFIVSGKSGKGILLVVEDRKFRTTFLEQILKPSVKAVLLSAKKIKLRYPEWHSMTTDNDLLFVHHRELEARLGIKVYFCFPGHMWEKPSVENLNGRIRTYIPKSSDISKYSKQFIKRVETKMNGRFMKILNYKTPKEMMDIYRKTKNSAKALQTKNRKGKI